MNNIYPDLTNTKFDVRYHPAQVLFSDVIAGNPETAPVPPTTDTTTTTDGDSKFGVLGEDELATANRSFDGANFDFALNNLGAWAFTSNSVFSFNIYNGVVLRSEYYYTNTGIYNGTYEAGGSQVDEFYVGNQLFGYYAYGTAFYNANFFIELGTGSTELCQFNDRSNSWIAQYGEAARVSQVFEIEWIDSTPRASAKIESKSNSLSGSIEAITSRVDTGYARLFLDTLTGAALKSKILGANPYLGLSVDLSGKLSLDVVDNDNAEDKLLTWNSSVKNVEYRTLASILALAPDTHFGNTNLTQTAARTYAGAGYNYTLNNLGNWSFSTAAAKSFSVYAQNQIYLNSYGASTSGYLDINEATGVYLQYDDATGTSSINIIGSSGIGIYPDTGKLYIYGLTNDNAETNLIGYDTATSLLTYRSVASIATGLAGSFIQNQAAASQSANFWITGRAQIGGSAFTSTDHVYMENADNTNYTLRIHNAGGVGRALKLTTGGAGAQDVLNVNDSFKINIGTTLGTEATLWATHVSNSAWVGHLSATYASQGKVLWLSTESVVTNSYILKMTNGVNTVFTTDYNGDTRILRTHIGSGGTPSFGNYRLYVDYAGPSGEGGIYVTDWQTGGGNYTVLSAGFLTLQGTSSANFTINAQAGTFTFSNTASGGLSFIGPGGISWLHLGQYGGATFNATQQSGGFVQMASDSYTHAFYMDANTGYITMQALASGVATPTPTGTEHWLTIDANGLLGHRVITAGAAVSFGAVHEIPFTNATTDDFNYSSNLTYNTGSNSLTYSDINFLHYKTGASYTSHVIRAGASQGGQTIFAVRNTSNTDNLAVLDIGTYLDGHFYVPYYTSSDVGGITRNGGLWWRNDANRFRTYNAVLGAHDSLAFESWTTTNFIQNQSVSAQSSSNFWISGNGIVDGKIIFPGTGSGTGIVLGAGSGAPHAFYQAAPGSSVFAGDLTINYLRAPGGMQSAGTTNDFNGSSITGLAILTMGNQGRININPDLGYGGIQGLYIACLSDHLINNVISVYNGAGTIAQFTVTNKGKTRIGIDDMGKAFQLAGGFAMYNTSTVTPGIYDSAFSSATTSSGNRGLFNFAPHNYAWSSVGSETIVAIDGTVGGPNTGNTYLKIRGGNAQLGSQIGIDIAHSAQQNTGGTEVVGLKSVISSGVSLGVGTIPVYSVYSSAVSGDGGTPYSFYGAAGRLYNLDETHIGSVTDFGDYKLQVTGGVYLDVTGKKLKATFGSDATGDIYYRDSSGDIARLAIGTAGQYLKVQSGIPAWQTASGGSDTTFADTDLVATGNRAHDWATYTLAITNASTIVISATTGIDITDGTLGYIGLFVRPTFAQLMYDSDGITFDATGGSVNITAGNEFVLALNATAEFKITNIDNQGATATRVLVYEATTDYVQFRTLAELITDMGIVSVSDGDKGDIVVSGSGATWTIDNDVVTYAKMQNVSATSRLMGRITAGAGDMEELTGTQATTLIDVFGANKGLVPASAGGTTNFLRADGTWAAPGGGGMSNPMTTLGDIIYGAAAGAATRLAGNTVSNTQVLKSIGAAGVATAPQWAVLDVLEVQGLNYGTYTPTLTNTTNVSASIAHACQWSMVGDMVTYSGKFTVTNTAIGVQTRIRLTVPVASGFTNARECGGVAACPTIPGECAASYADTGTGDIIFEWIAGDTASHDMSFCVQYKITPP